MAAEILSFVHHQLSQPSSQTPSFSPQAPSFLLASQASFFSPQAPIPRRCETFICPSTVPPTLVSDACLFLASSASTPCQPPWPSMASRLELLLSLLSYPRHPRLRRPPFSRLERLNTMSTTLAIYGVYTQSPPQPPILCSSPSSPTPAFFSPRAPQRHVGHPGHLWRLDPNLSPASYPMLVALVFDARLFLPSSASTPCQPPWPFLASRSEFISSLLTYARQEPLILSGIILSILCSAFSNLKAPVLTLLHTFASRIRNPLLSTSWSAPRPILLLPHHNLRAVSTNNQYIYRSLVTLGPQWMDLSMTVNNYMREYSGIYILCHKTEFLTQWKQQR
jgi:hypothetical protein